MPPRFEKELSVALKAVSETAGLCRDVQGDLKPASLSKEDKSPVTVADFGSQALVCRALGEEFPGDSVIAEEDSAALRLPENAGLLEEVERRVAKARPGAGREEICSWIDRGRSRQTAARFWTLDPIDGTKGFLRKEQYAVALALIVDGRLEVGALACPNLPAGDGRGLVAAAVRGAGAFAYPVAGAPEPLKASPSLRFCESVESGHTAQGRAAEVARLLGIKDEPVRMDSQSKYAVVARGEAGIYMRLPTKPGYQEKIWDHAAGALIVAEAGGVVSDALGKPLDFTRGAELSANKGVVAAGDAALHGRVIEALRKTGLS